MTDSTGWKARHGDNPGNRRFVAFAAVLAVFIAAPAVARADIAAIVSNLSTEPAIVNDDSRLEPGMALWAPLPVSTLGPGAMRVEAVDASCWSLGGPGHRVPGFRVHQQQLSVCRAHRRRAAMSRRLPV